MGPEAGNHWKLGTLQPQAKSVRDQGAVCSPVGVYPLRLTSVLTQPGYHTNACPTHGSNGGATTWVEEGLVLQWPNAAKQTTKPGVYNMVRSCYLGGVGVLSPNGKTSNGL